MHAVVSLGVWSPHTYFVFVSCVSNMFYEGYQKVLKPNQGGLSMELTLLIAALMSMCFSQAFAVHSLGSKKKLQQERLFT